MEILTQGGHLPGPWTKRNNKDWLLGGIESRDEIMDCVDRIDKTVELHSSIVLLNSTEK